MLYVIKSFSSVAQSCLTLWDPIYCSTPGFPVHHKLPEPTQTHVHWVSDAIQPSHLLPSPSPPAFNLSQHQGLFQWISSSHQVLISFEVIWREVVLGFSITGVKIRNQDGLQGSLAVLTYSWRSQTQMWLLQCPVYYWSCCTGAWARGGLKYDFLESFPWI